MKYRDALYETENVADLRALLNRSVEHYGDRAAYLVKNRPGGSYEPITYREFRSDVTKFGTALLDLELQGKKIAVIGENRYEWVVTYLATTCGVGIIVPIDRELSAVEVANLIERSGASAIVFSGKFENVVDEALAICGDIDIKISMDMLESNEDKYSMKALIAKGAELIAEGKRDFFRLEIKPDEMCSLIFTSGTTGLAKGVMLSHTNLTHNVVTMQEFIKVNTWTVLDVLPMHHTYEFTCGILATMYQGCTVAICEGLKYIVKNMAESKAEMILGVPLMFEKMHQKIWKQAEASGKAKTMRRAIAVSKAVGASKLKTTKKVFKSVHNAMGGEMKLIIAGGAAIDPNVIEDFNAMGINMIQGYGMTENSPIIAVNKDRCHKAAAAGIPMGRTEVRIDDPDDDGIGEVICRGPSVMLGYYENPEETAKVFLEDGWMKTGDYGYLDDDGFLFLTGRKKNVIVTKNGKNVFPEEVEYYLLKSNYVEEAVAWGKDDDTGDTVICAEIFPNFDEIKEKYGNISEEEIKKLLDAEIDKANELMPTYKRVKRFTIRDVEFEKTTTQKIKRHTINQD